MQAKVGGSPVGGTPVDIKVGDPTVGIMVEGTTVGIMAGGTTVDGGILWVQ